MFSMMFLCLISQTCDLFQQQFTNTVFCILLFSESTQDTKDKAANTADHDDKHIEDLDGCVVCVNGKVMIARTLIDLISKILQPSMMRQIAIFAVD